MTFRPQFRRNTSTTGRVVDTGPPRTNTGLTGLGAVGGPTGVGAGALRVIVEFLTQYDAKAVAQLEKDLAKVEKLAQLSDARAAKSAKAAIADEALLNKIKGLRQNLNANEKKVITEVRALERSRVKSQQVEGQRLRGILEGQLKLRSDEVDLLINQDRIESKIAQNRKQRAITDRKERERQAALQKSIGVTGAQLGTQQNLRANVVPKLGALALGAVGGIFGSAVVGLGFTAAQAALEAIGNTLVDLADPARHAREELKGIADEINKLAEAEGLTTLEASKKFLDDLGTTASDIDPEILALAASTQTYIEALEKQAATLEIVRHQELITNQAIRDGAELKAKAAGTTLGDPNQARLQAHGFAGLAQAQGFVADATEDFGNQADIAAEKAARLKAQEDALAGAGQRAAFAQDALANAIREISAQRISGLQDQLDAINSAGPSQRTLGLENTIRAQAEASARAAAASQLRNLAEERGLLLLEQRIRFQGQSINLDQVSGRVALVAINARIEALQRAGQAEQAALDALNERIQVARDADSAQDERDQERLKVFDDRIEAIQKEGDAQERVNSLLDLQFKMRQTLERNEGESIADFIQRRAQEGRQLLAEQDALRRDTAIDAIQSQKDEVQAIVDARNERREAAIEALELDAKRLQSSIAASQKARDAEIQALQDRSEQIQLQVELEENARAQQEVRDQERQRRRAQALDEELRKSQEKDRRETESRRKAIQDQIDAEREKADKLIDFANLENIERLRISLQGARTQADAAAIMGELAGANRALAELSAYAKANHIDPAFAELILGPLRETVAAAQGKVDRLLSGLSSTHGGHPLETFAKGGIIQLSNAVNPFGQNIRFGEEGREMAVILNNRLTRMMDGSRQPNIGSQSFTVNKSDDPYRDKQRFKRTIKDALGEALK